MGDINNIGSCYVTVQGLVIKYNLVANDENIYTADVSTEEKRKALCCYFLSSFPISSSFLVISLMSAFLLILIYLHFFGPHVTHFIHWPHEGASSNR